MHIFYGFYYWASYSFYFYFWGQFTEDGSFIGQYVPGKLQPPVSPQPTAHSQSQLPPQGTNAVATYV